MPLIENDMLPIPPGTCTNVSSRGGLFGKKKIKKRKRNDDIRKRNLSLEEISAFESTLRNFTAAEEHKLREQKVNAKIKMTA